MHPSSSVSHSCTLPPLHLASTTHHLPILHALTTPSRLPRPTSSLPRWTCHFASTPRLAFPCRAVCAPCFSFSPLFRLSIISNTVSVSINIFKLFSLPRDVTSFILFLFHSLRLLPLLDHQTRYEACFEEAGSTAHSIDSRGSSRVPHHSSPHRALHWCERCVVVLGSWGRVEAIPRLVSRHWNLARLVVALSTRMERQC